MINLWFLKNVSWSKTTRFDINRLGILTFMNFLIRNHHFSRLHLKLLISTLQILPSVYLKLCATVQVFYLLFIHRAQSFILTNDK